VVYCSTDDERAAGRVLGVRVRRARRAIVRQQVRVIIHRACVRAASTHLKRVYLYEIILNALFNCT
jgi:hypothetical protein